jgi:hypothetical protein
MAVATGIAGSDKFEEALTGFDEYGFPDAETSAARVVKRTRVS